MAITSRFYHSHMRNIVLSFGTIFNHMSVLKSDGSEVEVPLTYASKERWHAQLKQNANKDNVESITYPRMAFIMGSPIFDPARKMSSLGKITGVNPTNPNIMSRVFNPVPYNIPMTLYIGSKTVDESLQLIEQILPFFTPSFNITIHELEEGIGVERDIPIVLESLSYDDDYESSFDEFRLIQWEIEFKIEANIFGPVKESNLIKHVITDLYPMTDEDSEPLKERITLDINPDTAYITDNFGFDENLEILDFHEPKVF